MAAATGSNKDVRVLAAHETCEGLRVLITDAVPVPCGFEGLVSNHDLIMQQLDMPSPFSSSSPRPQTLEQSYLYWTTTNGLAGKDGKAPSSSSSAAGLLQPGWSVGCHSSSHFRQLLLALLPAAAAVWMLLLS
jgi:hypothetical protein